MMPEDLQAENANLWRRVEAWRQLNTVLDPELDEPVTELGFVSRLEVDAHNNVRVDFRLPTYWCAANFAFMMASDMRDALVKLDWVNRVKIVLGEHMYADQINRGVADHLSFAETFKGEADGNLDEIRHTFNVKAYQRRQEALILHLLDQGMSHERVGKITILELEAKKLSPEGMKLRTRYLERRSVVGNVTSYSLAFVTTDGQRLTPDSLDSHLAGLRRVRANAEFNSSLCRGLLAVRFDIETPLSRRKPKEDLSTPAPQRATPANQ